MAQDKKIEDYLHLYLGCEAMVESLKENFNWVGRNPTVINGNTLILSEIGNFSFKPILRPLSDMSEEEAKELATMLILPIGAKYSHDAHKNNSGQWVVRYGNRAGEFWIVDGKIFNQFQTIYLLSKHFDLFGLIEVGIAIDSKTLK